MARRRKSSLKAWLVLAAAVGAGTYFSDEIKEKYHSVVGPAKK